LLDACGGTGWSPSFELFAENATVWADERLGRVQLESQITDLILVLVDSSSAPESKQVITTDLEGFVFAV
jgi:hypothetical protein